jgi:uncharacterized protein (TIGR01777 family)
MPTDLEFAKQSPMPASPAELFDWHARPGAFARLAPPWERIEVVGGFPEIAEGSRVTLRMAKGPLRLRWVAEHRQVRPGEGFQDVQVRGPFAFWAHDHLFERQEDGTSLLHDRIRFRPPAGAAGRLLMAASLRRDLERTFRYRHATTAADLELHAGFRGRPRLRVAISGAGGLVGRTLAGLLTTGGHEVVRLVRTKPVGRAPASPGTATWDPARGLDADASVEGLDALIHLAGEPIAGGRWTARRRGLIRASRVDATRNLVASLARLGRPPKVLVSASAVGFYGDRGDEAVDETAAAGTGFLADLCADLEQAALGADAIGTRAAVARLGVVLSPAGGLLARLLPIFRCGLGGRLGGGRQRLSWISVDDAAAALLHLLMTEVEGPVNLTAPEAPSNRAFTARLAAVLRRPAILPVPAAALRLLFGRLADEMMLAGIAARPGQLEASGFRFRHSGLEAALRHLLGRAES